MEGDPLAVQEEAEGTLVAPAMPTARPATEEDAEVDEEEEYSAAM